MTHKSPQKRSEAPGRLDPQRARELLELSAKPANDPDERAFLAGPKGLKHEELADELGESFVASATSGEPAEPERRDRITDQDRGGPFVTTTARQEFAEGTDRSNPEDAEPAAFPTANRVGDKSQR